MNIKHAIKNLNSMKMNYDQWDKKAIPIQTIDMAIEALEKQYDDCAECIEASVKFEVRPDVGTVYVPKEELK